MKIRMLSAQVCYGDTKQAKIKFAACSQNIPKSLNQYPISYTQKTQNSIYSLCELLFLRLISCFHPYPKIVATVAQISQGLSSLLFLTAFLYQHITAIFHSPLLDVSTHALKYNTSVKQFPTPIK